MKFYVFLVLFESIVCDKCGGDWWSYFKDTNACYMIAGPTNFEKGQQLCSTVDAKMASIHSEKENNFIVEMAKINQTLIGALPLDRITILLGGKRKDGKFQWLDGTPFDFEHWAAGEPNNWKDSGDRMDDVNEDCMALYTEKTIYGEGDQEIHLPEPYLGRWNDNLCDQRYRGVVCKKTLA
ncbi:unnamed protein product, partial [Mesorhabditis belari]|uniref:C-type lectin domain-containing protein n=1 Tax=Mesorhabditis belari TaxID=2138241 RepID=A0AAF3F3D0_9BILA